MVSAEHLYTNRITVSAPWAHSGLLEIACELKVSNDLQLMRLAASEKLASKIQQRKDPAEDLKQMTHYRDTDDSLIEEGVTQAVADVLQGGVIILPSRYTFKGAAGDLDGLVAGRYKDQQVVVLAEAKHNRKLIGRRPWMSTFKPTSTGKSCRHLWLRSLKKVTVQVMKQCRCMICWQAQSCWALAAPNLSEETVSKHFADVHGGWFYEVNTSGRFVAKPPS